MTNPRPIAWIAAILLASGFASLVMCFWVDWRLAPTGALLIVGGVILASTALQMGGSKK